MEVHMQIGVGGADPTVTTANSTQQTYKLFWFQKDTGQWNILCQSSWKYTDSSYQNVRVWSLVPDTVFNAPGFDPQVSKT